VGSGDFRPAHLGRMERLNTAGTDSRAGWRSPMPVPAGLLFLKRVVIDHRRSGRPTGNLLAEATARAAVVSTTVPIPYRRPPPAKEVAVRCFSVADKVDVVQTFEESSRTGYIQPRAPTPKQTRLYQGEDSRLGRVARASSSNPCAK